LSGRLVIAVLVALALVPSATAGAQSRFTVVEIGMLPGFDTSTGAGINDRGEVAGTGVVFVYNPSTALPR
jgi:hypothetical protein